MQGTLVLHLKSQCLCPQTHTYTHTQDIYTFSPYTEHSARCSMPQKEEECFYTPCCTGAPHSHSQPWPVFCTGEIRILLASHLCSPHCNHLHRHKAAHTALALGHGVFSPILPVFLVGLQQQQVDGKHYSSGSTLCLPFTSMEHCYPLSPFPSPSYLIEAKRNLFLSCYTFKVPVYSSLLHLSI